MPGRPPIGIGHYLRDLVYGASDGVVTTLAVLAGTTGAAFSARVGMILGLANLVADGFSMGASNYLGLKSEIEQAGTSVSAEQPWRHGSATAASFAVAGSVPLVAYVLVTADGWRFPFALLMGLTTLAGVGALRSRFVARPAWLCSLEMVTIAGGAAGVAYALGLFAEQLVR